MPGVVPSADELARLRVLRDVAWAIASGQAGAVSARLEPLLVRYAYRLTTDGSPEPLESGWDQVTAAAIPGIFELSDAADRLCRCGNPACGWLFIDRSRNRSRRWCDMGTCGSRAKMARYRRRKRAVS